MTTSPSSVYNDPNFTPGVGRTQDRISLPGEAATAVSLWIEISNAHFERGVDPDAKRAEIRRRVDAAGFTARLHPYLDVALAHPVAGPDSRPTDGLKLKWTLVQALAALVPPPPKVVGHDTSTHCRHDVAYTDAYAACDAEFA